MRLTRLAVLGLAAGVACARWMAPGEHGRVVQAETGGTMVDDNDCLPCHAEQGERLSHTVHRHKLGCQACHGPGSAHVADPSGHIVGAAKLRALSAAAQSDMCLGCHGQMAMSWGGSEHASANLPCSSCHSDTVHFRPTEAVQPPLAFRRQQGFCQQCHRLDVLGFQQIFHHPVPEGAMDCSDCHSVHARPERALTLDQDGRCARCHRRQVSTYVFSHQAMREGCLTCHQAHGSALRALLAEPANTVCMKCHFQAGFPIIEGVDHTDYLARGGLCYDCHTDVHGSNADPSLLGRLR